jgi:hypothetical protein
MRLLSKVRAPVEPLSRSGRAPDQTLTVLERWAFLAKIDRPLSVTLRLCGKVSGQHRFATAAFLGVDDDGLHRGGSGCLDSPPGFVRWIPAVCLCR